MADVERIPNSLSSPSSQLHKKANYKHIVYLNLYSCNAVKSVLLYLYIININ